MKKIKTIFIIMIFIFSACSENNDDLQNDTLDFKNLDFKTKVFDKNLDKIYGIDSQAYARFTESLIFDDKGRVIGADISSIKKRLDDSDMDSFLNDLVEYKSEVYKQLEIAPDPKIFQGYKPKPRGCKRRNNWICIIYGEIVQ
ncbi:hypothetical protein [Psychroflexus sp. MBR-150]|jgi:hypothetical protein